MNSSGRDVPRAVGIDGEFAPPAPSALVEVHVGDDRLPTRVTIGRRWASTYHPSEYAGTIFSSYRYALFERAQKMIQQGRRPVPANRSLREAVPALLRTRTYDDYLELRNRLLGSGESLVAAGPGFNEFDEPTVVVKASRIALTSIFIDSEWAQTADAFTISADIMDCVEQIRSMRAPLPEDPFLSRESDEDLFGLLVRHQWQLLKDGA